MSDTRVKNKEMRESAGNTQKVRARVRCGCRAAPDGRFCHRWLCALWPESLTLRARELCPPARGSCLGQVGGAVPEEDSEPGPTVVYLRIINGCQMCIAGFHFSAKPSSCCAASCEQCSLVIWFL